MLHKNTLFVELHLIKVFMAKIIFKWSDVHCTSSNPSVDLDHLLQSLDTAYLNNQSRFYVSKYPKILANE